MSSSRDAVPYSSMGRACSHAITSVPLHNNSITLSRFSHPIAMQRGVILCTSLQSIPTFRPKSHCIRCFKQFSSLPSSPWFFHLPCPTNEELFAFNYLLLTYLITYLLTYSMEQSLSWEANRFAASQEIPRILWKSKVHYRIHKCPPPVPILNHLDPIHTPTSHFLKTHFNIIFSSTPGIREWSRSLRFPHRNSVHNSPLPIRAICPAHLILLYFISRNNIGWGVQIIKLLIM